MADNNTEDIHSTPINSNMDNKPLPPQPERIRHLPEWETPLHPPRRRRDESTSVFSRLQSLTIPKPAIVIAMPPALGHATTFTTRRNKQKKKKAVPISKQSISAPFAFSPGTTSPAGSMSMLSKEMLLSSPTGSRTLLPIHHTNARSSHTLNTTTTGWSPPSTPLQYPHNHGHPHQSIDEKTTTHPKSSLKSLSYLKTTHLPNLKLHLTTSLNTLLPKKEPSSSSTSNTPPKQPPTKTKFPHNLLNLPRRNLILYIIIPLSTIFLLSLILGLGLGLGLRSHNNTDQSTLPLPWNPLPSEGSYSGDLTFYDIGLGACGYNNTDTDLVCAVGQDVYDAAGAGSSTNPNENVLCGRKIKVWREGDSQEDGVIVKVVDRCTGCKPTDLDLSPGVFGDLGVEADEGRVRGRWVWV